MKRKIKKTQSLFFIFIIFAVILSTVNIVIDNIFYGKNTKEIMVKNGIKKVYEKEILVKELIKESEFSLKYLREVGDFNKYLSNQIKKDEITQLLYSYTKTNPFFMQLRYIDKYGKEQIRINRDDEFFDPYIAEENELQDKSDRYYFIKSKKQPLDKIWFSSFDLNEENITTGVFNKKTFRAILPLEKEGKFNGIIIINYFIESFLSKLTSSQLYDVILSNNLGDILYYSDSKKATYDTKLLTLDQIFPKEYKEILNEPIFTSKNLASKNFDIPIHNGLNIILRIKDSYLQNIKEASIKKHIFISISILVISMFLSLFIIWIFRKTLLNLEELEKFNQHISIVSKVAKMGFWEYDATINKIVWDDGAYEIYEIEKNKKDITKEYFMSFFIKDDIERINAKIQETILKEEQLFIIEEIQTYRNNTKYIEIRAQHYYDKKGVFYRSIGSIHDITEEYIKQKEIDISKERFQLLVDSTKDGIWDWDAKNNTVYFSDTWKSMIGYKPHEIEGKFDEWRTRVHKDDIDKVMENLNLHLERKVEFYEATFRLKHKDGSWVWILGRGKGLFDENDQVYRMLGFHTDISEQKELECTLQEQKEKFETIYNYSKDGIAIIDMDFNFLDFNNSFLKLTGYEKDELFKKSYLDLISQKHKKETKTLFEDIVNSQYITNYEKTYHIANDKKIYINISASLLPDKKSIVIVTKDMTFSKLLDEQSKLATMGEMIGNIAHQWRQPLSIISTSASSIKFKINFDDSLDKEFLLYSSDTIVNQINYLSNTIDDFRNFLKTDKVMKNVSIVNVLEKTFRLVDASIGNNYITLVSDLKDDLTIIGNSNELQQAFINIINNAKDAIKKTLTNDEDKFIFVTTNKIDESTIQIEIFDTGGGIDEEIMGRLFEPYFTTKDATTGTGIGLTMANKIIVEKHKGEIDISNKTFIHETNQYKGACFTIRFNTSL